MKVFYVNWGTGHAKVNVGNFFSLAKAESINKLLRLAKRHCSEKQRTQLLKDLQEAKLRIANLLNNCQDRDGVNVAFIRPFSPDPYWQPRERYQKELNTQCGRIEKCIKKIEALTWGRVC